MVCLYWWRPVVGRPAPDFRGSVRAALTWQPAFRNFGDELSPLIVGRLAEQPVTRVPRRAAKKLLALGSILNAVQPGDQVWGSGLLVPSDAPSYCDAEIHAVRGPLSRRALMQKGFAVPELYGDPAELLPLLFSWSQTARWRVGFVPHFLDYKRLNHVVRKDPAIKVIDVLAPPMQVVQEIIDCDVIYASSLHALIVANAFGIPHGWISLGQRRDTHPFKFQDYFAASGAVPACVSWSADTEWPQLERSLRMPRCIAGDQLAEAFPFRPTILKQVQRRPEQVSLWSK